VKNPRIAPQRKRPHTVADQHRFSPANTPMALSLDLPQLERVPAPRRAPQATALPRPQRRDVHLWELHLDQPPDAVVLLDATERTRAQRFVHDLHRTRYIAAHAWLRRILGCYLACAPQDLEFVLGPHGKPELRAPWSAQRPAPLRFNLSHSDNRALLAVSNDVAIGVDIEAIRPDLPDATLAAGVLTAAERAELEQTPAAQRAAVFFACWTRKEACMKALGLGLALEPRSLHVGMTARRQTLQIEQTRFPLDLSPLPGPAGFAVALAAVGGFGEVTRHHVDALPGRLN
jgi:4'-phosphopantetheinyl transferase